MPQPLSKRKQRIQDEATGNARTSMLARIHIAKKSLIDAGLLTEDAYRATVHGILIDRGLQRTRPEPSAADLDAGGMAELLDTFRQMGWDEQAGARVKGRPEGRYKAAGQKGYHKFLTQTQADYIAQLEDTLDWTDNYSRLVGFIRRQLSLNKTVPMLTNREASRVITGLERLAGIKPNPSAARSQA